MFYELCNGVFLIAESGGREVDPEKIEAVLVGEARVLGIERRIGGMKLAVIVVQGR